MVRASGSQRLVLATMVLASVLASVFWSALALALPDIRDDLGGSTDELRWAWTAAGLAYAATLVLAGRIGDTRGARGTLVAGFALLAGGAAGAAAAPSPAVLIAALCVMGLAGAVITPMSLAVVTETAAPERRARNIALWAGAGSLAYGLGPAIGGTVTHLAGWRWIFIAYVPLALLGLVLTRTGVPASRPDSTARVDYAGAALLAGGLVALTLTLGQGAAWGWLGAPTVALAVLAVVLLAACVRRESRVPDPLLDLRLFALRVFSVANAVLFFVNFVLGTLLFFVPLYLQEVRVETPLTAGLLLVPFSGGILVAMALGARLTERGRTREAVASGLVLAGAATMGLVALSDTAAVPVVTSILTALGGGLGLVTSPLQAIAMDAVPARAAGAASGILATSRGLGTALGVAATGAVFSSLNVTRTLDAAERDGVRLTEEAATRLDTALADGEAESAQLLAIARDAWVDAFTGALWLSVAAIGAGLVLVLARMPRSEERAADDRGDDHAQEQHQLGGDHAAGHA